MSAVDSTTIKPDVPIAEEGTHRRVDSGTNIVIRVEGLGFSYGNRMALEGVDLAVSEGEMLALLGPNGSGKSTLLRTLATLYRPTTGDAELKGVSLLADPAAVRRQLGVVFQAPGLDGKLSVAENLRFQGYLYGLSGKGLKRRIDTMLERFGLEVRRRDKVETLSGGLQRRVELAKALLHDPPVLLLDEPSTGLDLAARRTLWSTLDELRKEGDLTVIVSTHLMEEAESCDRVALLDAGRLVALDDPTTLRKQVGETVVTLESDDLPRLERHLVERFKVQPVQKDGQLRINGTDAAMAQRILAECSDEISALRLGRPTLGDVFLALTGHEFSAGNGSDDANGGPQ